MVKQYYVERKRGIVALILQRSSQNETVTKSKNPEKQDGPLKSLSPTNHLGGTENNQIARTVYKKLGILSFYPYEIVDDFYAVRSTRTM